MSLNVPKCHTCDIGRCIYKRILRNRLDPEMQSNVTHFREKRFLL